MVYTPNMNSDTLRNRGNYDPAHMSSVTPAEDLRSVVINRVASGPVIAGVVMALVAQFIFNLAGIGLGVVTLLSDTTSNYTVANLSLGTAIWWTVSGIVSAYLGGYTAGRLSGDPTESSAGWHGLTSWATSVLILSCLIMAGSGAVMGGMLNTTSFNNAGTLSMRGQQDTTVPNNAAGTTNSVQVPTAPATAAPATVMDNATLSKVMAEGALMSAIALLLGALAAWFGGRAGTIKPTITTGKMSLH